MSYAQDAGPFAGIQRPRAMPVLILADVSGSMGQDGKIKVLNESATRMISSFAATNSTHGEITVGVITFGDNAALLHQPVVPATQLRWADLSPGNTPMGQAFALAVSVLDDEQAVSEGAYRPAIVLVSDGMPTDDWQEPLAKLTQSRRGSKAVRLAVAVGTDVGTAAHRVLEQFVSPGFRVFPAEEAERLRHFFQWVTLSVSQSIEAGTAGSAGEFDLDELYDPTD